MVIYNLIQSSSYTASVWFEVLLTAERYFAVCKPLKVAQISTKGRVRSAVITVWVSSIVFNTPRCFDSLSLYGTTIYTPVTVHSVGMIFRAVSARLSYIITYYIVLRSIVNLFLPFSLFIFFTVKILSTLRKSYFTEDLLATMTEKQKKSNTKNHRRTVTIMLSIVTLFTVAQLLSITSWIRVPVCNMNIGDLSFTRGYYVNADCKGLKVIDYYNNLMSILQSSSNFFLFSLAGHRYRQILRKACNCQKLVNRL
jgi:hypothetical protein